jgi:hypothetical protein
MERLESVLYARDTEYVCMVYPTQIRADCCEWCAPAEGPAFPSRMFMRITAYGVGHVDGSSQRIADSGARAGPPHDLALRRRGRAGRAP